MVFEDHYFLKSLFICAGVCIYIISTLSGSNRVHDYRVKPKTGIGLKFRNETPSKAGHKVHKISSRKTDNVGIIPYFELAVKGTKGVYSKCVNDRNATLTFDDGIDPYVYI